ncbi:AAA family ATPase [Acinetobacter sp. YH12151]|uniref:AAA family ATPase n=1 Tax=Acinetobacter sp. YH12151 TaxID=2601131 RepID=UPI0015D15E86|nr:AAA family ATPase [Acinetobacter sp. YH12151]
MSKTLTEIAQQLKDVQKKVQLIYAFNGTGKTRLSREFKQLISTKSADGEETELSRNKILYYNAFTEDLFYWDNDLEEDAEPKLKIQPNSFTDWILRDRGQDRNIIDNFQRYTDDKLSPIFIEEDKTIDRDGRRVVTKTFPEVVFSFERGTERTGNVKISKGEESNFVWSVFYTLLEEVTSILDEPDPSKRDDNQFDNLEYVFIDDPVSSLDDNHLIDLAVDLAVLVKSSKSNIKFVITTHSPLFYNVLCNELSNKSYEKQPDETYKLIFNPNKEFKKHRLEKKADGLFQIIEQPTDSPFSYHLLLLSELQSAIKSGQIRKYHFNFLRNILEKMATFLGYNYWPALLPKTDDGKPDPFANRILNLSSHSAHAGEEISDIVDTDKEKLDDLVEYLIETYGFRKQEEQHG